VDFENDAWRDARRKILADNEEALVTNEEDEGGAQMTTPTPYSCDRYDRLVAFENAVLAAEEATEKRRTVAELSRRVAEKKNRDAFVAFLEKKRDGKAIDASNAVARFRERRVAGRRRDVRFCV
jgi:hypothetical protein